MKIKVNRERDLKRLGEKKKRKGKGGRSNKARERGVGEFKGG